MLNPEPLENSNDVIDNIKKLLDSEKKLLIEKCYSVIRDKNKNRIFDDSIEKISNDYFDSFYPLISVVILTANKYECDALNYILSTQDGWSVNKRASNMHLFPDNTYCAPNAYLLKKGTKYILHLKAFETGSNTPGGSTDLVRLIESTKFLKPNLIISFGICYGRNPNEQSIGDVLIPRKLYPWSIGQKVDEKGFHIKHDDFNLTLENEFNRSNIYPHLRNIFNDTEGKLITETITFPSMSHKDDIYCEFSIKTKLCNMSTGEAVVSSKDLQEQIANATLIQKEMGGEMEGYGLAKECINYAKIPCFIIKSICDWGQFKDIDNLLKSNEIDAPNDLKDKLQAFSSFCAGIILKKIFEDLEELKLDYSIIHWMSEPDRGTYLCDYFIYNRKNKILYNIKNYYGSESIEAENILKLLLREKLVIKNQETDTYKTIINKETENG